MCFSHGSPCYLPSLGSWTIGSLPFGLELVFSYEWVHTMFTFLGQGYFTQDVFSSSIHLHPNFKMSLLFTTEPLWWYQEMQHWRNSQEFTRMTQLRSQQAIEERVPELVLPCSQIDEYLKCHYRNFIFQLIETETETCSGALGWTSKVQLKSRKNENMSKEVKTMMGTPSETVYLS